MRAPSAGAGAPAAAAFAKNAGEIACQWNSTGHNADNGGVVLSITEFLSVHLRAA